MINDEIWKPVIGYEGLYEVSNLGHVRSLNRIVNSSDRFFHQLTRIHYGKTLTPSLEQNGYLTVRLCYQQKVKAFSIHKLVAQAFIPNPNNLPQVNHKDEDKTNNCVDNLEWCTAKYNCNYGTRSIRLSNKLKGRVFTDDQKQHMSESQKGKVVSDDIRKKISESHKGIKFTEEHKQHISEKLREYKTRTMGKKVKQINPITNEIIKVWPSLHEIERSFNVPHIMISRACKSGKIYCEYKWEYYLREGENDGKGET